MKKLLKKMVWVAAVAALGAAAGELPFTATLVPYQDATSKDNMVAFNLKNDSTEPITSVVITRNNGTFECVSPLGAGLSGVVVSPELLDKPSLAKFGYIREFWQYDQYSYSEMSLLEKHYADVVLKGFSIFPSFYTSNPPTSRSINRTGNFADFTNIGDYFIAHSHGYLTVLQAGNYRFKLKVDDGAYITLFRKNGTTFSAHTLFKEAWSANSGAEHFDSQDVGLNLQADEVVYLSALHAEVGGEDCLKLEWARENPLPTKLNTLSKRNDFLNAFNTFAGTGSLWNLWDWNTDDLLHFYGQSWNVFVTPELRWKGVAYTRSQVQNNTALQNEIRSYINGPGVYGVTFQPLSALQFTHKAPATGTPWYIGAWPELDTTPLGGSAGKNKTIRITDIPSFNGGVTRSFTAALTEPVSAGYATTRLWNLDAGVQKTTIQVFGAFGNTSTVTLDTTGGIAAAPDAFGKPEYVFKSEARPVKLTVRHIDESGQPIPKAARFNVTVFDPTRENPENQPPAFINIVEGVEATEASYTWPNLRAGMQVTFEAVEESYFDENGTFLYDTSNPNVTSNKLAAVERFVASGLSVNETAQTGDLTRYRFEIRNDTIVEFRTRHEFALDVVSDFSDTASHLTAPGGAPWAGPLTSAAAGSPEPSAGVGESVRHWIKAGEQVVAQVDAEVQDLALCAQMLYTRYVPYEYLATGAARGDEKFVQGKTYTNSLAEPKLTGQRHQINFKMDRPGSIAYRWKIQFGVYAQSPEMNLRKVLRYDGTAWNDVDPVGAVYWFDQWAPIRVLTAANRGGVDSKALTGWILGDGYYFQSECSVNTDTGEPVGLSITLDANNNPVGQWVTEKINGKDYRGMEIVTLLRPVAVTWSYGRQVFYDPVLKLGEYMLQGRSANIEKKYPAVAARMFEEPTIIDPPDAAVWDPNARVLFPIKPGFVKAIYTGETADTGFEVHITANWPDKPHYAHIADTPPVQLTPDPAGNFHFVEKSFAEESLQVVIMNNSEFTASGNGWAVLRFKEVKRVGRTEPKEFIALRTVRTQAVQASLNENRAEMAIIGQAIRDPLDLAKLGTGYLVYQEAVRYNPNIYDIQKLSGLRSLDLYDMNKLKALYPEKVIVNPGLLPGPIIPVNEYPAAVVDTQWITVAWYDDPIRTDGLLWPHAARRYTLRWPTKPEEGLGRIVIASEWGSESLGADGFDQTLAFANGSVPAEKMFNPTRFADLKVYSQGDRDLAGYNPNEEHALIAPSFRYAAVSPRPNAVYALRAGDLNNYGGATSKPFVLVQFFDNVLKEYGMRVFSIAKEDANLAGHFFAAQSLLTTNATGMSTATSVQLDAQPKKKTAARADGASMEAGEPVPAFYPIGVVEGAVPCPESVGINLRGQLTFWKDHKYTRWSVSGGPDAWFSVEAFYPLQPDFWWPEGLTGATLLNGNPVAPQVGASVAFLPPNLNTDKLVPTRVLYKSEWPRIAPVLKAGETLTYSGGEYRADHPTKVVPKENGVGVETIQTPGLPAAVAFAVGEVIFDNLNPKNETSKLMTDWTVRITQALASHSVSLSLQDYPDLLQPANGKTRLYQGKYIFKDLPASLQKRVRYDPVTQRLELRGVLNDKTIEDATLTAAPGAVYTLEPNILTQQDVDDLLALADASDSEWRKAVNNLRAMSLNPNGLTGSAYTGDKYVVGLQPKIKRDKYGIAETKMVNGLLEYVTNPAIAENARAFGVGLAVVPNGKFLDPKSPYPDESWVTIAENNDPSMGGSPVALHVIKVDRRERYRGAIKVVLSDNVFDENVVLRHTGDFGANGDDLMYEWWYRPDDGQLNVLPPFMKDATSAGDWKLFPDLSGKNGLARNEILMKGDPNAPETLLADSWWFVRYRHTNDVVSGVNWKVKQPDNAPAVNYTWAGAGNSDPFNDFDLDGYPDYKAQLVMGWIKRVLDAVNPYEARIRDFTGDAPATQTSMLQQLGPRYEGPVALNPAKNVIENVGLIELYQTVLNRAMDLSINLSSPVSTPAIANALQLASTRLSDFYMLLGNEAYVDANDPTIGYGSSSVEYGAMAPVVHAFQNQASGLLEEELMLLRGQDDNMARPVYNRLFWNFTKGEGEAAYAMNYNISDINKDGFIDEYDAMILYPQGHGDAWGHYLTALKQQYNLLNHKYFNWVARSEFYNLMNVVMKVDFLDERKFAQVAAQKAKAGAEIVASTYRQYYTEDETAQWQGYTDVNVDRAWGVQDWARRAGQGAYFDWVTANALLPSVHPNTNLTGIAKVDRQENADIRLISANINVVQNALDDADCGFNPLGISSQAVPFDINPQSWSVGAAGRTHFEQVYERAVAALLNAQAAWDHANAAQNRLRKIANTEQEFRNDVWQQDIAFRNRLVEIFGRPYPGTVGSGKFYPDGYQGPDITYYMYVAANNMTDNFPKPMSSAVTFDANGNLVGGMLYDAIQKNGVLDNGWTYEVNMNRAINSVSRLFGGIVADSSSTSPSARSIDGHYDLSGVDFNPNNNPLAEFDFTLPIAAWQYSMVAPDAWGERPVVGDLQQIIGEMLRQQVSISTAIDNYQCMWTDILRAIALLEIQREVKDGVAIANNALFATKFVTKTILQTVKTAQEIIGGLKESTKEIGTAGEMMIPLDTGVYGLANGVGDLATAPVKGTLKLTTTIVTEAMSAGERAMKILTLLQETLIELAEGSVGIANANRERYLAYAEALAGIDSKIDNDTTLRLEIFQRAEQMRALGDKYRSTLSKGALIIDEREAFNRRVAAMVQQGRYQDMAFRVERNAALQNYHRLMDIAARYAYLAAKAYDYDTNLAADDPASPSALFDQIVKERALGYIANGQPQIGKGLAGILAQLNANHGVMKHRLGLNNPQIETGKLSLRTEHFRIFPSGYQIPDGASTADWTVSNNADDNWQQTLSAARVKDLWTVPEFRYLARPFNTSMEAEPGIVLRFGTQIKSGFNVFGKPLAGGDHAYDPSVFATRIRSVGVWFSGYLAEDVLTHLSATPRVYLIPTGADIMSIPNAPSPDETRVWNVLDQVIPVPFPGIESKLPLANFVPLLDSLDGRIGQQRRFSSFRAYHDSGTAAVNINELVRDSRLVGRSVWNTGWVLIIPGRALNADPNEGLDRFIENVSDIKLVFETYGFSGN